MLLEDADMYMRVVQGIARKDAREDELASCEGQAQAEFSAFFLADVVELLVKGAVYGVEALNGLIKTPARIGEGQARVSFKQADAQLVLKVPDVGAQSLLGYVVFLRGVGDIELICDGFEISQCEKVHNS